jgi:lipoprotein-releasing system permease protein
MLFELSVAKKYLIPRKNQLSASLIALMSVIVISLVVWLILVFLSVTDGMEQNWLQRLTALNAPLRITPTQEYYTSYYYKIDRLSSSSQFSHQSIGEKAISHRADPHDSAFDPEIPLGWPSPECAEDGSLKDPVKLAFRILSKVQEEQKDLAFQDYEVSGALLRLRLIRPESNTSQQLTQVSYLASFPDRSPYITPLLLESVLPLNENGIILPKNFLENGVRIGDSGFLSYQAATMNAIQEQRLPISVAGFYDPGIMSIGNKFILVPHAITRLINGSGTGEVLHNTESNGILVWIKEIKKIDALKRQLLEQFEKAGISHYWKISTYKEYDFAKDLLQQFQSDKYLFTLLAGIILLVACCNIISLLVLLVSDKKKEIGILQAMGASSKSIALIFALCGIFLGLLSSLIGIGAALLTLHNIHHVVHFLSFLQGHEAFNALFYGASLPNQLSQDALIFVLIATPLLSLAAGLVPAIKACCLRPSQLLRSE